MSDDESVEIKINPINWSNKTNHKTAQLQTSIDYDQKLDDRVHPSCKAEIADETQEEAFDIVLVSKMSFDQLETVYREDFPKSNEYKELVIKLHDNMIEYNFLQQAGLLQDNE